MTRQKCVDSETIYDFAQGLLDEANTKLAAQHIGTCARCQTRLAEARSMLNYLQDDALLTIPARAHQRGVNLFRPWFETRVREGLVRPKLGLKQFLAQLITDTRGQPGLSGPVVAGLRSTAFLNRDFQLLYSLDEGRVEVDLKVSQTSSEGFFNVLGQVVGLEDQTCKVELVTADETVLPASLDETFTFQYHNLASGTYSFLISCDDGTYEISSIRL